MDDRRADRYPRSWIAAGGPPRAVRWAARYPAAFAVLLGAIVAAVIGAPLWWLVSPLVAVGVASGAGAAVAGGSLAAQRDLRALLARWDAEHTIR